MSNGTHDALLEIFENGEWAVVRRMKGNYNTLVCYTRMQQAKEPGHYRVTSDQYVMFETGVSLFPWVS